MRAFISHWSGEKELAVGLANWLDSQFGAETCFCSPRPSDLWPGHEWFERIREQARDSDLALLLISPDSAHRDWIYYEAGLVLGSSAVGAPMKSVVPVLYGGAVIESIGSMLRQSQALDLNESGQFDATIRKYFDPGANPTDTYFDSFRASLSPAATRIMKLGYFAGFAPDATQSEEGTCDLTNAHSALPQILRESSMGKIAAVRLKFMPRQLCETRRWKFGLALKHGSEETFLFHANCENKVTSWSLYPSDQTQFEGRPYNIPASLEWDKWCHMSVWFRDNGNEIAIGAVDSNGEIVRIPGKAGDGFWRLIGKDWEYISISAWNDEQSHPYQIDVKYEVDRVLLPSCDPLLPLLGSIETSVTDVSDRHDEYIGKGIAEEGFEAN